MLGTVCRAGDLLDLFDADNPEWGAAGAARRLQIARSQAHEMLVSLEAIGLLRRSARGRFRLGWKMVTMSQNLMRSEFNREELAIVRDLGRHTNASVELITHDGVRCVRIGGYGVLRQQGTDQGPLGAAWKVLLADMPKHKVEELFPGLDVHEELDGVRRCEVAIEDGARSAVAAPVHDSNGAVLAALLLTVQSDTWMAKQDLLTRALTGAARRLSASIRVRQQRAFEMAEPRLSDPTPDPIMVA